MNRHDLYFSCHLMVIALYGYKGTLLLQTTHSKSVTSFSFRFTLCRVCVCQSTCSVCQGKRCPRHFSGVSGKKVIRVYEEPMGHWVKGGRMSFAPKNLSRAVSEDLDRHCQQRGYLQTGKSRRPHSERFPNDNGFHFCFCFDRSAREVP